MANSNNKYKLTPENLKDTLFDRLLSIFQDVLEGRSDVESAYKRIEQIWKILSPKDSADINKTALILDPLNASELLQYNEPKIRRFLSHLPYLYHIKGTSTVFKYVASLLGIEAELIPWHDPRYLSYFSEVVPCTAVLTLSGNVVLSEDLINFFEKFIAIFQDVCLALSYVQTLQFTDEFDLSDEERALIDIYLCDSLFGIFRYLQLISYNPRYTIYVPPSLIPGAIDKLFICNDSPINLCDSAIAICPKQDCLNIPVALYDGTHYYAGLEVPSAIRDLFILEGDMEALGEVIFSLLSPEQVSFATESHQYIYPERYKEVVSTSTRKSFVIFRSLSDSVSVRQERFNNIEQHTCVYYDSSINYQGAELYYCGGYTVPGYLTFGDEILYDGNHSYDGSVNYHDLTIEYITYGKKIEYFVPA